MWVFFVVFVLLVCVCDAAKLKETSRDIEEFKKATEWANKKIQEEGQKYT